ncbi:hypothetical protein [Kitasatospora sp. NBC_01302]|uniref:hypothetical protein n=1 Tax=Kitasatospora sp. NBC_01302 TaxID=2903575 RepID=UPI002E133EED|nr:hypothetical protein OG294_40065 [Kitasatospora sp. NBC_01302]
MSQQHLAAAQQSTRPDTEEPDLTWNTAHTNRLRAAYDERDWRAAAVLALFSLTILTVLVLSLGPYVLHSLRWIIQPEHSTIPASRLWNTVNQPIHAYLAQHSTGLAAGPRTLYTAWGLAGALILIRALRRGATVGVQLGALVFGALTVAMVWSGTNTQARPVAAGLAALAWAVLAALALTGSWITTHLTVVNEPPAQPTTAPAPAPVVPVTVQVPEPRIEAVVVDVQRLQVDINGRRLAGGDTGQN